MIRGMRFLHEYDRNLDELTNNTIIMCNSTEIKQDIVNRIMSTCISHTDDLVRFNDGVDWLENVSCECTMDFPQTTIFEFLDGFKLIITVENAFIFSMETSYDLWFARKQDDKLIFIPFTDFDDNDSINKISTYKSLSVGRFSIDGSYGR